MCKKTFPLFFLFLKPFISGSIASNSLSYLLLCIMCIQISKHTYSHFSLSPLFCSFCLCHSINLTTDTKFMFARRFRMIKTNPQYSFNFSVSMVFVFFGGVSFYEMALWPHDTLIQWQKGAQTLTHTHSHHVDY